MDTTCPRCGSVNPHTAQFCGSCRHPLQGLTVAANAKTRLAANAPVAGLQTVSVEATQLRRQVTQALGKQGSTQVAGLHVPVMGQVSQREDTVLAIDISGSMAEKMEGASDKLQGAKIAGATLLWQKRRIDPRDRIAVVSFDDQATLSLPLTPISGNESSIQTAMQALEVEGGTDLNAPLALIRDQVFDWALPLVTRRIVLLTDGHGGYPIGTAEELKSRGVVIDCVGIGPDPAGVNEELLRKMASVIQGRCRYRFIRDSQTLVGHYTQLANKTQIA